LVHVSTNAGASWHHSIRPAAGVKAVTAATFRNGRLFAGTFGQGVFISDDLGTTWQAFNQGLVGGFLDSQLDIDALQVRGESLYVATAGAGVYVRRLVTVSTWSHFGEIFEPQQASNVVALALGGTRLLALGGGNGEIFRRDPGQPEWTITSLDNVGLHPGLAAQAAVFNGAGWVVGCNVGVFHSVLGQEPWTRVDLGLGVVDNTAFATRGSEVFGAFTVAGFVVNEHSEDNGTSWTLLDVLPNAFVFSMASSHNELFAGRTDGLWRRDISTVSVPPGSTAGGVRLEIAGAHPVHDAARVRFVLTEPASATIELFDVTGRRAGDALRGTWPAGVNEVRLSTRSLAPGVYGVRFVSGSEQRVIRMVRI
jgi:hypothetical protein